MRNPLAALADLLFTRDKDRKDIKEAHADMERAKKSATESQQVLAQAGRKVDPLERQIRAAYQGERRA